MADENTANGKATTTKKIFSRETVVEIDISTAPEKIWNLLTDTERLTSCTDTIVEIDGTIALGEKIRLRSSLAPERTFKLKVKTFEPNRQLAWGDAMGTRTYTLTPISDDVTRFRMAEKIGGPLFPLFAGMIPSFDDSFDQFAADLKAATEASNS